MRPAIVPSFLVALLVLSAPAAASSFAGTSAGTSAGGTSATSGSTSGDDDRVARAARADAARFVASEGALRGATLEAALRDLRRRHPDWRDDSDMRLAQAILTL